MPSPELGVCCAVLCCAVPPRLFSLAARESNRRKVPSTQHAARSTQRASSRGQVDPVPARDRCDGSAPILVSEKPTDDQLGPPLAIFWEWPRRKNLKINGVRASRTSHYSTAGLQIPPGAARDASQLGTNGKVPPTASGCLLVFGGYPPSVPIQCPPRTKRHTSWEVCCRRTPALKSKASRRAQIRMRRIAERAVGQGKRMHDARGIVSLPVGLASLLPLPNARNATTSLASRSVLLVVGFLAVSRKSTSRAGRPKS